MRLLRRHDHHVDVAGGCAAAQRVRARTQAARIVLPTARRACRGGAGGRALTDQVMVSIDLGEIHFS
ncbi:hypothetical protein [Streptomyces sp. NPDC047706]|uniref:hypothetical protein n=1 Tax=Streptomyces sp. NPDC047706 TaxID=3365486 RepID=UPI003720DE69